MKGDWSGKGGYWDNSWGKGMMNGKGMMMMMNANQWGMNNMNNNGMNNNGMNGNMNGNGMNNAMNGMNNGGMNNNMNPQGPAQVNMIPQILSQNKSNTPQSHPQSNTPQGLSKNGIQPPPGRMGTPVNAPPGFTGPDLKRFKSGTVKPGGGLTNMNPPPAHIRPLPASLKLADFPIEARKRVNIYDFASSVTCLGGSVNNDNKLKSQPPGRFKGMFKTLPSENGPATTRK